MRQILYKGANKRQVEPEPVESKGKGVSVLTLFKQRYTKRIKDRREILAGTDNGQAGDLLKHYNRAVQLEFADLQENHPEEYAALKDAANAMREAAKRPFHEQSPDVQEA